MAYRVGIIGSSGTGKSSFAEALANELRVPCLKSKEITQHVLERDGYNYSSGVQIERFLATPRRQGEILRRTIEQQSVEQFVTDRTMIDLAAYALVEMHDEGDVGHIYDTCKKNTDKYTHIFLLPFKDVPVKNNGKRTLNPWYQKLVHTIERGIMEDWNKGYWIINSDDTEERIVEAMDVLHGTLGAHSS